MKHFLLSFVILISSSIFGTLVAQSCPTTILSTQTEVNNFICSSVAGDLIIEDDNDGIDNIVDLDPIYVNGMNGLSCEVSGDLILRNCDHLISFFGLDGIRFVGNDLIIQNNDAMIVAFGSQISTIVGDYIFEGNQLISTMPPMYDLVSIGKNLKISNNASLTNIPDFGLLGSVGADLQIEDNDALTNFSQINALTSIGGQFDIAKNDNLISFTGTTALQTVGQWINFNDNQALTTINSFDQVTTVGNSIRVQLCPLVNSFSEFPLLVSTSLILIDQTNLSTLSGFQSMINTDTEIEILRNPNLTSISAFSNLSTTKSILINSNGLTSLDAFNSLVSTNEFLRISYNGYLPEIGGFNQLTTIGGALIISVNSALTTINAFDNITTVSHNLEISANKALTDITAFPALTTVGQNFDLHSNDNLISYTGANNLQSIGNHILIYLNLSLTEINAFASLTNLAGDLRLAVNWQLSDCCIFLPVIPIVGGLTVIYDNATGCSSVSEIGAGLPSITCIADFTVSTTVGSCTGEVTMTDPSPTDDCGISSYTLHLVDANGTVVYNDAGAIPGLIETLSLPVGLNTYTYTAMDANGQSATCQTIVEVIDTEAPTWDDIDGTATITGECGIDNITDLLNANLPTATDNCTTLTIAEVSSTSIPGCGNTVSETHTFQATDSNNNISENYVLTIVLEDTTDPTISALPADITIFCDDAFPAIPTPTAADQCGGDLTNSIDVSVATVSGNCTSNTPAEIHTYTYSVDDGCGNIDEAEWIVTVMNDFEFTLGPDLAFCDVNNATITAPTINGTYLWSTMETTQSITVTASATYSVTITTNNGCCNSDMIQVTFGTAPNAFAAGGELDCEGTAVQILGNSTTPGVSYAWTGPGGYASSTQSPFVTEPGTYELTVTDINGCIETANAEVTTNINVPSASAIGGTLTCETTSVLLLAESTEPGVTFSWTGPNGYTSDMQNTVATDPGIYTVSVVAQNGCIGTASTEILDDTSAPSITVMANSINCASTSTVLMTDASANVNTYYWTGPNGFSSNIAEPTVNEEGTYNLTVTASNGCTNSTSVIVVGDFSVPDVTAIGGTLNCSASQIQINGESTTSNVIFSWTGPNGFMSGLQNPSVSEVGTYVLSVTAQNGCVSSAEAIVIADANIPSAVAIGGVIDCNNMDVTLSGSSDNLDANFSWTGPSGYNSNQQNPTVTTPGTYELIVSAPNGCSASQTTTVSVDTASSEVLVSIMSINCELANVSLGSTTNTPEGTFLWSGPNGFISSSPNPLVDEAGTYTLIVSPSNGCDGSASIVVEGPFGAPNISATGGTIGCTDTNIQLTGNSLTENATFLWTGPGNFSSLDQNPLVDQIGDYTLKVTSPNGCESIQTVSVVGDTDLPQISVAGGTLDCNNEFIVLQGSSTTANTTFSWTGPNGFISVEQNPTTTEPGIYELTVSTQNDCSVTASVIVEQDIEEPFISLSQGIVNCEAGTKVFTAETNVTNATFEWTGPNGFTSTQLSIDVSEAGAYTFTVFPQNGCLAQKTQDLAFDINYTSDIMTVDASETALGTASIEIIGGTGPFTILWDNGDTGLTASDLAEGLHTVTVIDGLACTKIFEFEIKQIIAVFEEELSSTIKVFPNPASNFVTVSIQDIHKDIKTVSIYDMTGNLIQLIPWNSSNSTTNNLNLDVSQLYSGMYLLKFHKEDGFYMKKIIIK